MRTMVNKRTFIGTRILSVKGKGTMQKLLMCTMIVLSWPKGNLHEGNVGFADDH